MQAARNGISVHTLKHGAHTREKIHTPTYTHTTHTHKQNSICLRGW